MADKLAMIASSPEDYQRLGLSPTAIAPWEDGARTDGSAGTYEWWYFDAHLADGAPEGADEEAPAPADEAEGGEPGAATHDGDGGECGDGLHARFPLYEPYRLALKLEGAASRRNERRIKKSSCAALARRARRPQASLSCSMSA